LQYGFCILSVCFDAFSILLNDCNLIPKIFILKGRKRERKARELGFRVGGLRTTPNLSKLSFGDPGIPPPNRLPICVTKEFSPRGMIIALQTVKIYQIDAKTGG
jgi:hypothetical protein